MRTNKMLDEMERHSFAFCLSKLKLIRSKYLISLLTTTVLRSNYVYTLNQKFELITSSKHLNCVPFKGRGKLKIQI